MHSKHKEAPYKNRSLLFAIEDLSKLLRSEVKKEESRLKKDAKTVAFVNTIEQIAKLLRTQTHKIQSEKKKSPKSRPDKFYSF